MQLKHLLVIMIGLYLLSACGQKGPLYLPNDRPHAAWLGHLVLAQLQEPHRRHL